MNKLPTKSTGTALFSLLILFCMTLIDTAPAHGSVADAPYDKTVELYQSIAKNDTEPDHKWEEKIRLLTYTNLLVFRSFCSLADISKIEAQSVLLKLKEAEIRYETATMLDFFCSQPNASAISAWHFLARLNAANFVVRRTLDSLTQIDVPAVNQLFPIIDLVEQLDESGQWAAKALFEVTAISFSGLTTGLNLLTSLNDNQNRAVERFCQIYGMDESTILKGIREISKLSYANSWNSRSIFLGHKSSPASALLWLTDYLTLSTKAQNQSFLNFTKKKKTELLAAYEDASEKLIWQINNLHDVTDNLGREIGNGSLRKFIFAQLLHLFKQLDVNAQNIHQAKMDQAISTRDKDTAIKVLHLATARARKETARKLATANIYVLLAQGNDLYDSSFRDILVPVLTKRLKKSFQNDLLTFLLTIDPTNVYSSKFITNLAQKGKLTLFFPEELNKQKEIIDLVTRSAFHDENSLILFSATFTRLLQIIHPEVRSHLIGVMLKTIKTTDSTLTSQLQVILQHYFKQHQELLLPKDKNKITAMISNRGKISVEPFIQTPFAEWLQDRELKSLSVFQRDDDGRSSLISFCRSLIKKGYKPSLSKDYQPAQLSSESRRELATLFAGIKRHPENSLGPIFRISIRMPIVIEWKKKLNGVTISHSVFVYQGKITQQELLAQFLSLDHEMFAQRGHSYWRYEQLIDPFEALLKRGFLSNPEIWKKQRFLSIGSCGGIKVYRKLSGLFHNHLDILATVGTGKASINNPYNIAFFEIIAAGKNNLSWDDISRETTVIFSKNQGREYLQPGSLPAILHKMMYMKTKTFSGEDMNSFNMGRHGTD